MAFKEVKLHYRASTDLAEDTITVPTTGLPYHDELRLGSPVRFQSWFTGRKNSQGRPRQE